MSDFDPILCPKIWPAPAVLHPTRREHICIRGARHTGRCECGCGATVERSTTR